MTDYGRGMRMYIYKDGMSDKEQKDGAYWERNMLVLLLATIEVHSCEREKIPYTAGWYYDTDNNWDGWKRVISLDNGGMCFHIPDDFDVGDLPEIKPNWNGHNTAEKWNYIMDICGVRKSCKMIYKELKNKE